MSLFKVALLTFGLFSFYVYVTGLANENPRQISLPCPAGCEANGNCNAEFGQCECQFGFGGDDCSRPLLSACMSSLQEGAVPQYGLSFPKNCFCFRQLLNLACSWNEPYFCNQHAFQYWDDVRCYEYSNTPDEQQLSDPPAEDDGRVLWKRGVREGNMTGPGHFSLVPSSPVPMRTNSGKPVLPLASCKDRCKERGTCILLGEEPTCECAPFYEGEMCEEMATENCPLGCSGRGTCHGGFCRCEKGFWGAGCARSKAYTAEEWNPHPTELRVYVYDLPEAVVYMRPLNDEWPIHHVIYLAEIEVYQRLLDDWTVRTENPWEANLFFIPTHSYYYIGNLGFPGKHFSSVFSHVRETYPWWNMTAGRNHVAATSNDRGCCDLYRMGADVQHPIKLVHFAQAPRHGVPLWRDGNDVVVEWGEEPERLAQRLQTSMEDPAILGAMVEFQHLAKRPRFKGFPLYEMAALHQEREQCYRPEHDVAFPPYLTTKEEATWPAMLAVSYEYKPDGQAVFRRDKKRKRDTFFFFDGYTKPDLAYSAGVRQGLLALFGNTTRQDVRINKGGGAHAMVRSTFCFTPMGFGWGIRLSQAVYTGCVPVMTHDHVWPALWDVLPYERFSVRVSRHNLHRLFQTLEAITPEQLRKLQDGLAEVHKAFVWQTELGGLAYNYTMLSLHRRLLNMWTAFF